MNTMRGGCADLVKGGCLRNSRAVSQLLMVHICQFDCSPTRRWSKSGSGVFIRIGRELCKKNVLILKQSHRADLMNDAWVLLDHVIEKRNGEEWRSGILLNASQVVRTTGSCEC